MGDKALADPHNLPFGVHDYATVVYNPFRLYWERPCAITPLARVEPQQHNSLVEGECMLRGRDEVMGQGA